MGTCRKASVMSAVQAHMTSQMPLVIVAIVSILNFGTISSSFREDRSMIGLRVPFFFGLVNITE